MHKGITLINGEAMHRAHPETFQIPSEQDKLAIQPGDFVKLGFLYKGAGERMWVQVRSEGYGELNNDPVLMPMLCGEPVYFEPWHILAILKGKPEERRAIETANLVIDTARICNKQA